MTPSSIVKSRVCIVVSGASNDSFVTGEFYSASNTGSKFFWSVVKEVHRVAYWPEPLPSFAITGAALCKVPGDIKTDIGRSILCRKRLFDDIIASGCDYILAVGSFVISALTGDSKATVGRSGQPYKITISTEFDEKECVIIPCHRPELLQVKPIEFTRFIRSIELAVHALMGKNILQTPHETKWTLLDSEKAVLEYDKLLDVQNIEYLACDIETTGLNYLTDDVLCIGLSHAKGQAVVIPQNMIHCDCVKRLMNKHKIKYIWHNGKFDLNFLAHLGYTVRVDEDTILLHYALDENSGIHGLELLSMQLLGASDYKKQLKGNLDEPGDSYGKLPLCILHEYQAKDADYTLQIFHILRKCVSDDPKLNWMYINILVKAQNFLSGVERRGFYTHKQLLLDANETLQMQIFDMENQVKTEANKYWDAAQYVSDMGVKKEPAAFNPGSPKQVAWLLYKKLHCVPKISNMKGRAAGSLPSTDEKTILSIPNKPPVVEKLLELRHLKKLHSTYVVSILDKRDHMGRIHSTYSLYGTTTGRLSSKKPNLQNIPRNKMIKALFGASQGRLIMECDYKSAELRALAMYSQDPFLIRIFRENFDMHDETASAMFGKDFTSEQRMQAKMINFGIMYGRGPKTIAEACKISVQEAQESINKWLARMPAAAAYLKSRRALIKSGCVLSTPFGRKRRFPLVTHNTLNTFQNEACNFAIQSIASDFTLMTGIRIQPELLKYDAFIVNLVHDSLIIELPDDKEIAALLFKWIPEQMCATPKQWFNLPFDFLADASIGTHWGKLYDSVAAYYDQKQRS